MSCYYSHFVGEEQALTLGQWGAEGLWHFISAAQTQRRCPLRPRLVSASGSWLFPIPAEPWASLPGVYSSPPSQLPQGNNIPHVTSVESHEVTAYVHFGWHIPSEPNSSSFPLAPPQIPGILHYRTKESCRWFKCARDAFGVTSKLCQQVPPGCQIEPQLKARSTSVI